MQMHIILLHSSTVLLHYMNELAYNYKSRVLTYKRHTNKVLKVLEKITFWSCPSRERPKLGRVL